MSKSMSRTIQSLYDGSKSQKKLRRHLKCNLAHPTCGPCARSGHSCQWAGKISFEHDLKSSIQATADRGCKRYVEAQKWVDIPRQLHFVDETREVQLTSTGCWVEGSLEPPYVEQSKSNSTRPQTACSSCEKKVATPTRSTRARNPLGEGSSKSAHVPQNHNHFDIDNTQTVLQAKSLKPPGRQNEPKFQLQDEQEMRLLRHFIDSLSPWFDVCDLKKHFATEAPRRALACPTLLNAILAVSALHMSRTLDFSPLLADHYCQLCLSTLIPALQTPHLLKDEDLFSAVVILRLFEELEGSNTLNHLLGIQVFLFAQDYTEIKCGLGRAAFQVAMRQEIAMAFMHRRPVLAKIMEGNTELSFSPACESIWAYRSSIYFAVVLQFCYGNESPSFGEWQELVDYYQTWLELRPPVFEPLYVERSEASGCPKICYLDDIHVITANNYSLAQILLAANDPQISATEKDELQSEIIRQKIEYHIRELCGTALSNAQVAVATLSASVSIAVFGDQFSKYETQVLLLGTLTRTEKQHGWSTKAARKKLIEAWGWTS